MKVQAEAEESYRKGSSAVRQLWRLLWVFELDVPAEIIKMASGVAVVLANLVLICSYQRWYSHNKHVLQ